MTEMDWLACTEPNNMLDYLRHRGQVSDRKLRLLLCACCRHRWFLFEGTIFGRAIELGELLANGLASKKELRAVRRTVDAELQECMGWREEDAAFMLDSFQGFHFEEGVSWVTRRLPPMAALRVLSESLTFRQVRQTLDMLADFRIGVGGGNRRQPLGMWQCRLIDELVGPCLFRQFHVEDSWLAWNDGTVPKLAQAIDAGRAFDCMPVLADALEEAGCQNQDILGHLREPGAVHVRGCFVLDLLRNKEFRP